MHGRLDNVGEVHFCNLRGRMRVARRIWLLAAAALFSGACGGPGPVGPVRASGEGVITAAQVFQQMMVEEEAARAREAKERAEDSDEMRYHRNRFGGSRPPPLLREVPVEDWLAIEEGRFAHSIKIPNPVPADSGYRPGMTQQQYFEHLCENEAGEFIFKTVDNVEGLYQIRPRRIYTDQEWRHLYALEDPYGYWVGDWARVGASLANPNLYRYFEIHPSARRNYDAAMRELVDASLLVDPPPGAVIARYAGYDGSRLSSLKLEYDTKPRARYGFTWRGVKRPMDREMGIAGGELIVLDLQTMEVMGVRRGYNVWNGGWTNRVCPRYGYSGGQDRATYFTAWFVAKVARPSGWKEYFAVEERGRRIVGNPYERRY